MKCVGTRLYNDKYISPIHVFASCYPFYPSHLIVTSMCYVLFQYSPFTRIALALASLFIYSTFFCFSAFVIGLWKSLSLRSPLILTSSMSPSLGLFSPSLLVPLVVPGVMSPPSYSAHPLTFFLYSANARRLPGTCTGA